MKMLFFDMEFADGRVPGSIYSLGYLVTDENFKILTPPTDVLINPESTWNAYVVKNILAYPKAKVTAAPSFEAQYKQIKKLFDRADLTVGFAVGNDVRALRKDCERYGLPKLSYRALDMEQICKQMEEHREAHGLAGYVRAWCGETPKNQHRSDGDAYATMRLLQEICKKKHVTPDMLIEAFPESCMQSEPSYKGSKQKGSFSLWKRIFGRHEQKRKERKQNIRTFSTKKDKNG